MRVLLAVLHLLGNQRQPVSSLPHIYKSGVPTGRDPVVGNMIWDVERIWKQEEAQTMATPMQITLGIRVT